MTFDIACDGSRLLTEAELASVVGGGKSNSHEDPIYYGVRYWMDNGLGTFSDLVWQVMN
jgi:hypothetical protein